MEMSVQRKKKIDAISLDGDDPMSINEGCQKKAFEITETAAKFFWSSNNEWKRRHLLLEVLLAKLSSGGRSIPLT